MKDIQQYSVILLFSENGSKILLQKKDRTDFKGMLNGVGGKVEDGEKPLDGALRELMEETTLKKDDLLSFQWIGRLTLPIQCDRTHADKNPDLWFYAGVVKDGVKVERNDNETEDVNWYPLDKNVPITNKLLAGDGNLTYFIGIAKRLLFNGHMPA